jgi:hypothetical protein
MRQLILQEDDPDFETENYATLMIREMRKLQYKSKGTLEMESIKSKISLAIEGLETTMEADTQAWHTFLSAWRVFCMSETFDKNLLMWAQYSDKHAGAAIGLRRVPRKDSASGAALPVVYSSKIPSLGSLQDWVDHIIGIRRMPPSAEKKFIEMTYTKSIAWQYEKEWRYAFPSMRRDSDFELREIASAEIHSVYLGCRMPDSDKERISNVIAKKLDHVLLFQAERNRTEFKLDFRKLN